MISSYISSMKLLENGFANTIVQSVIFEIVLFLLVPVIGILVEAIIVNGLRGILSRIIGRKGEFFFSNYLLLAGVMIHELSHALFAFITGAKINEIALFKPDGNSLGHVSFSPRGNAFARGLQNCFSACAPVVTGIIIVSLFLTKVFPVLNAGWIWAVAIYIFVSVLFHMNMSKADLKCYFTGMPALLLVMLPVSLVYFFFFVN